MPEWNFVGHVLQNSTDLAVLCAVWSDSIVCTDSGNEASCGHMLAPILKDMFQRRKKYLGKAYVEGGLDSSIQRLRDIIW